MDSLLAFFLNAHFPVSIEKQQRGVTTVYSYLNLFQQQFVPLLLPVSKHFNDFGF
jgi:hypothetical protein